MRVRLSGAGAIALVVGMVLLVLVVLVVGPLLLLWALNTLFGFGFAFTLKNWFAMCILSGPFMYAGHDSSSSD